MFRKVNPSIKKRTKAMRILLLILCIFNVMSCSCQAFKCNTSYDIQIDYLTKASLDKRNIPNDILTVMFDGNFDRDTVDVSINDNFLKRLILTTDEIDGIAGDLETINYSEVDNISFRINGGKLIYIEPEKRHYNIRLTYLNDKVRIRFYRIFPGFM
jgi:hypothetical protein